MKFRIKESIGASGTVYYEPQYKVIWWNAFSGFGDLTRIIPYNSMLGPIKTTSKESAEYVISKYIDQRKTIEQRKTIAKEAKKKHKTIFHPFTGNEI